MFILQALLSVGEEDMYSLRRWLSNTVSVHVQKARTVSLYSWVEVVRGGGGAGVTQEHGLYICHRAT
jgi:hypothetical protein